MLANVNLQGARTACDSKSEMGSYMETIQSIVRRAHGKRKEGGKVRAQFQRSKQCLKSIWNFESRKHSRQNETLKA